ncbi:MAG: DUF5368 domain-containing protein [Zoogloeaceae bacterium]|jgi:hypothetical protein|nr:DUF5368 domain-containing protein [Zoogloeaceae bacterium]
MKDMELSAFFFLFQEMLGGWFWPLFLFAVIVSAAFVVQLFRNRNWMWQASAGLKAISVLGGALFVILVTLASSSGFTDAGGPIDYWLITVLFGFGYITTATVAYTAYDLLNSRQRSGK